MKIKKLLIIFLLFIGLLIFNNKVYAGTQKWNSLDYNVTVNTDGSMDVIETWNIQISETNTLFKDFEIDSSKYSGITDVKVYEMKNNEEVQLREIFEEQYHVDSGCYYGLKINSKTFEIAWNVGLDNSTEDRVYKVCYKVENAVKIYNDCTELYWMFLNNKNGIGGKNITGTIKLPQKVADIEKLRVWAHGDLSGEIQKESNDTVIFSMPSINANTMLEVRVVTEENIYEDAARFYNYDKLNSILEEEQKWADEANSQRRLSMLIILGAIIVNIIIAIFFINKIKKYIDNGKELDKYALPKIDLKYFRDIPDEEKATPARAAYLYYFNGGKSSIDSYTSKIFSATILDLTLKGILELEPIDKKNVKIKIIGSSSQLSGDELVVYSLLKKASVNGETTTKHFEKYCKVNYDNFYSQMKLISGTAKQYMRDAENIDAAKEKIQKQYNSKIGIYVILLFMSICFFPLFAVLPTLLIGLIVALVVTIIVSRKINILTEKGNEQRAQWLGLKNYMQDFSLLKDKEIPDLILWEKYLVYATTFGISKKVIEQLKVVYPEMLNENTYYGKKYTYMYLACNPDYGINFIDNLNNGFTRAYNAASSAYSAAHSSSSSGSGGGGGFSSGGGGGRWRRKLRWTLISIIRHMYLAFLKTFASKN